MWYDSNDLAYFWLIVDFGLSFENPFFAFVGFFSIYFQLFYHRWFQAVGYKLEG